MLDNNSNVPPPVIKTSFKEDALPIGATRDTLAPGEILKTGSPSTMIGFEIEVEPLKFKVAGPKLPPINLSSPEPSAAAVGIESVAPD